MPGFCKTARLDDVRRHDHKLTPGIYVGTEHEEADDTPFEVKMAELESALRVVFKQSNAAQARIVRGLGRLA